MDMSARRKAQRIREAEIKDKKMRRVTGNSMNKMRHLLRKKIVYEFFLMRDGDLCARCQKPVLLEDSSIDHIDGYWHCEDINEAFFNIDRVKLAHFVCNSGHTTDLKKKYEESRLQKKKDLEAMIGRVNGDNTKCNPHGASGDQDTLRDQETREDQEE